MATATIRTTLMAATTVTIRHQRLQRLCMRVRLSPDAATRGSTAIGIPMAGATHGAPDIGLVHRITEPVGSRRDTTDTVTTAATGGAKSATGPRWPLRHGHLVVS